MIESAGRTDNIIVRTVYQGQPGHPVLFDPSCFPDLLRLTGDQGAKSIIHQHPDQCVRVPAEVPPLEDVDTLEDYLRVIVKGGQSE